MISHLSEVFQLRFALLQSGKLYYVANKLLLDAREVLFTVLFEIRHPRHHHHNPTISTPVSISIAIKHITSKAESAEISETCNHHQAE